MKVENKTLEINPAGLVRRESRLISRQRLRDQSFAVDLEHLRRRVGGDVLVANVEVAV